MQSDFATGAGKLSEATRKLKLAWDRAADDWDDATSRAFEENLLDPLLTHVKTTLDATSRIAEIVSKAQRECDA